ncbi:MAG: FG-GAP repeat domain-containing protein, partial [Planctomycetota bacterium]
TSTSIAVGMGDVVVSGPNGTATLQKAFEYRLGLTAFGTAVPLGGQAFDIVAGDFNEDGVLDFAFATRDAFIGVRLGDGTGAFPGVVTTSVPGHNIYGIAAGHLDNDGHLDIVAADIDGSRILVFHGTGSGSLTYVAPTISGVGPFPERLRLGDLNKDGALDVVIPLFYTGNGMAPAYARVLLGDGAGHFQAPGVDHGTLNGPQTAAVADFDGDGSLDFLTTNVQSPSLSYFRGKGDGTFFAQVPIPVAILNEGLAIADFNKVGRSQVFVTKRNSAPVFVSFDQVGGFTTTPIATTLSGHMTAVAADVNRDGYPDVVAFGFQVGQHSVFLNDRQGGFVEHVFTGPVCDGMLVAGDFDKDGRIDIGLPSTSSLTIFLNK